MKSGIAQFASTLAAFGIAILSPSIATALTIQATQISPIGSGSYFAPHDELVVVASGIIDIANLDGSYKVDPSGTIVQAPPVGTGAYGFFFNQPIVGAPTIGDKKYMNSGNPFGSLLYSFSASGTPNSSDFHLLGTGGRISAPDTGGQLYFMVADINNYDNSGSFEVNFTSSVPELNQINYFLFGGLGLLCVTKLRNRQRNKTSGAATIQPVA